MPVTVTRYGGPMVMKPKSKTSALEDLDASTREALDTLLQKAAPIVSDPWTVLPSYDARYTTLLVTAERPTTGRFPRKESLQ